MQVTHCFCISLYLLLTAQFVLAGVANDPVREQLNPRNYGNGFLDRVWEHFRIKRTETCTKNYMFTAISNLPGAASSCAALMHSPNATITQWTTPTVTVPDISGTSSELITAEELATATSTSTVTATTYIKQKRDAVTAPEPTPAPLLVRSDENATFSMAFSQLNADSTVEGADSSVLDQWRTLLSSACDCLNFGPTYTSTLTSTAPAVTTTLEEFILDDETITLTNTVATTVVTTTVYNATLPAPGSTVPFAPHATGPIGFRFDCPNDDATSQVVVVYPEKYTFEIFCNSGFANETSFPNDSHDLSDCAATCANTDTKEGDPVCKGFSFDGNVCHLTDTASPADLISMPGTDSAILLNVESIYNDTFINPSLGSSGTTNVLAAQTDSSPLVTPPPEVVQNGQTTTFQSCYNSTWTDSVGTTSWTSSCTWNTSWYSDFFSTGYVVYEYKSSSAAGGSGSGDSNGGGSSGGGLNGGSSAGGSGGSSNSTGKSANSAILPFSPMTVSTVVYNSTSTYVTAIPTSGGSGGRWGTGGVIPPSGSSVHSVRPWSYNTSLSSAAQTGDSSGTGGVIQSLETQNSSVSSTSVSGVPQPSANASNTIPISWYHPKSNILPSPSSSNLSTPGLNDSTSNLWSLSTTYDPRQGGSSISGYPTPSINASSMPTKLWSYGHLSPPLSSAPGLNSSIFSSFSVSMTNDPRNGGYNVSTSVSGFMPLPSTNATNTSISSVSTSPYYSNSSCYGYQMTPITVTETFTPLSSSCDCQTSQTSASSNTSLPWPKTELPGFTPISSSTESLASSSQQASARAQPSSWTERQPGTAATADEIAFACSNAENQIYNGGFEIADDIQGQPEPDGWGLETNDGQYVQVTSFADPTQHSEGGSRDARFVLTNSSASAALIQPLTLCPGKTYALAAWARQLNPLDECTAVYSAADVVLGIVMPPTLWSGGISGLTNYTVGPADADAAVDFTISVSCNGRGDTSAQRVIDFDDVSLIVTS